MTWRGSRIAERGSTSCWEGPHRPIRGWPGPASWPRSSRPIASPGAWSGGRRSDWRRRRAGSGGDRSAIGRPRADLRRPPARPARAGLGEGRTRLGRMGRRICAARPGRGAPASDRPPGGLGTRGPGARRGRVDPGDRVGGGGAGSVSEREPLTRPPGTLSRGERGLCEGVAILRRGGHRDRAEDLPQVPRRSRSGRPPAGRGSARVPRRTRCSPTCSARRSSTPRTSSGMPGKRSSAPVIPSGPSDG